MQITEAGRAYVKTNEFLSDLGDILNALGDDASPEERQYWIIWQIALILCGLPYDYQPTPAELDAFMVEQKPEVMDTIAQATARMHQGIMRVEGKAAS